MWQCAARPILLMDQQHISEMINCVLILHNMCVSDRVMGGDVYATYNPTNTFESPEGRATEEDGNGAVRTRRTYAREEHNDDIPPTGIANAPNHIKEMMAQHDRWVQLQSLHEYNCLNEAIINTFKK